MKVLHAALISPNGYNSGPWQKAFFENGFEYTLFDWQQIRYSHGIPSMKAQLLQLAERIKPDLIWMQVQTDGVIDMVTLKELSSIAFTVIFTFDVRDKQRTEWLYQLAPFTGLICFACQTDVDECLSRGYSNSMVLQSSCDMDWYKNQNIKKNPKFKICFVGNNTLHTQLNFPLAGERSKMVGMLKEKFPDHFQLRGNNWTEYGTNELINPQQEISLYNESLIAINHNQFSYPMYTSDRLWRIMASGTFCLTKYFHGIESEFQKGKHLDWWQSINELEEKINYYLKHDKEREEIAKAGMDLVRSSHSWTIRVKQAMYNAQQQMDKKRIILGERVDGCNDAHRIDGIILLENMLELDGKPCDCGRMMAEKYECGPCGNYAIKIKFIPNPNY